MPKRTKYRKQQKGKRRGLAYRGSDVVVRRLRPAGARARLAHARARSKPRVWRSSAHTKRAGKLYIRVFPDKPLTQEAARDPHG